MAKAAAGPSLAQEMPGNATNEFFQLIFAVTGQKVRGPGFIVPPGCSVTVQGLNGNAINAEPCFIAQYGSAIGTNASRVVPPGGDVIVPWPVDNLAKIYTAGTEGDGLLIQVQGPAIQ